MGTTLIVGTSKGLAILKSEDRKSWSFDGLKLPGWRVTASTRDAKGRTYLGVAHDIYGTTIMVSDDLENWRQLENIPSYSEGTPGNLTHNKLTGGDQAAFGEFDESQRHLDQVWKLHALGDRVFAGVSEAGLFYTDDQGESWTAVDGLNNHPTRDTWEPGAGGLCLHSFLVDETNPERMWIGISAAGVFRTDDGGKTWEGKNDGVPGGSAFCVHSIAHDPKDPNRIFRQDHRGVYRSDDGGDSWVEIENGLPQAQLSDDQSCSFGFPMGYDPATGSAFVVPLDGDGLRFPKDGVLKVFRTQDGGAHWDEKSKGLPANIFASVLRGAMALDKETPAGVYFGTSSGNLFASADLGESWQEIPASLPRVLSVGAYHT